MGQLERRVVSCGKVGICEKSGLGIGEVERKIGGGRGGRDRNVARWMGCLGFKLYGGIGSGDRLKGGESGERRKGRNGMDASHAGCRVHGRHFRLW